MAGANYMGGKRNAAKVRSKDTTGRAQKGYFGRQRLEALTKGLRTQPVNVSEQSHLADKARSEINLAHAQHDMQMTGRYTMPATPQPKSFTSKQSYSGLRSKRSMASSSSSSSSRSSKVLAALDTSEPLSMRAEMNRILTLPDFAGLSQKRSTFSDSRSIAPKRRLSSISVDWDEDHKVKRPRLSTSPVNPFSANFHHDALLPSNDQLSRQDLLSLSPLQIPICNTVEEPLSLVPDYSMTLSSILDDLQDTLPRELSHTTDQRQNYTSQDFESMKMDTSYTHDDSGYAEFEAELQNRDQHHPQIRDAKNEEVIQEQTAANEVYTSAYCSQRLSLHHLDSSMLCLDTSPPTSSSTQFEKVANCSQLSNSSSLESYLPDFSVMEPQLLNPNFQPMTPFAFKRSSIHHLNHFVHTDPDPLPSSAAEPPPPTLCLPSPKHETVVSISPKSQATVPEVLSSQIQLNSPLLTPTPFEQDSGVVLECNLLDEADPWDAIGRLLDLKKTTALITPQLSSAPTHQLTGKLLGISMNDRSGVGYFPPQIANESKEEVGREPGILFEDPDRTLMENINLPSSWSHVQICSTPLSPVLTTNMAPPSEPSVSSFLITTSSAELERAEVGGRVSALLVEEPFGTLEAAFSDDEYFGTGVVFYRSPGTPVFAHLSPSLPISNPASPAQQEAERAQTPATMPNFQGPYLFYDLGEDDE